MKWPGWCIHWIGFDNRGRDSYAALSFYIDVFMSILYWGISVNLNSVW